MTDDEIQRDLALSAAATAPPWDWFGNTKTHEVYLATADRGRVYIMDFDRWGMSNGQPRFQIDHVMRRLGDLGKEEHPLGPIFEAAHRRQFRGIGHPDARFIVAACNGYGAALREVQRLRRAQYLNPGPTLHGSTLAEIAAERDQLRADLATMTAARDEACAIAERLNSDMGDEEAIAEDRDLIAALRAIGSNASKAGKEIP